MVTSVQSLLFRKARTLAAHERALPTARALYGDRGHVLATERRDHAQHFFDVLSGFATPTERAEASDYLTKLRAERSVSAMQRWANDRRLRPVATGSVPCRCCVGANGQDRSSR